MSMKNGKNYYGFKMSRCLRFCTIWVFSKNDSRLKMTAKRKVIAGLPREERKKEMEDFLKHWGLKL